MRTLAWAASLIAICLGVAAAEGLAPEVADWYGLTGNPGFEAGDEMPDFWRPHPPEPQDWGSHLRDTEISRSGQASGLLISEAEHPAGKAQVQWNHYTVPVEASSTVLVSYWVRTDGVPAGGSGCHFYDAEGEHLGFGPVRAPAAAGKWTYVRGEVDVPAKTVRMGVALYGRDLGRTWYDDAVMLGTPETDCVRATPAVDGRLDEGCWAEAAALTRFVLDSGEALPQARTQAWVAYDDDALYLAFRCPVEGDVQADESVEVFVDPGRDREDYFHLSVNALGTISDARGDDPSWESGARAAVTRGDVEWTIEIALPYDGLDVGLGTGEVWGLNLARHDRERGERAVWSLGGEDEPGRFGRTRLSPDLTRFYPVQLAAAVERLRTRADALREEIAQVSLDAGRGAPPLTSLLQVDAELVALLALAARQGVSREDWDAVPARLTAVADGLTRARELALRAIFDPSGDGEAGGFRVAIAGPLTKVPRTEPVPDHAMLSHVDISAARDESESFQLVVIPTGGALSDVSVSAPALTGPGAPIELQWHRVGYVETAEPKYAVPYVGWWPDPLLPPAPFDVKAGERQPLWFTVDVPPDAAPGRYTGQVTLRHGEHEVATPVELTVRSFRLPRPGRLATPFGLYASSLSHWWSGKQPYREHMPIEMFSRWCEFMGRYRLTPKNIAREYLTKTTVDGQLSVDMSALQQTVAPLTDKYFAPYSFCLHRLPSAATRHNSVSGTDPQVTAQVTQAFVEEWRRQGLPDDVYIYGCDEPKADDYEFLREAYRLVREVAPEYPIMQTIGSPSVPELVGLVDIWCPLTPQLQGDFYRERREAGDTLWSYVCCSPKPPHANFFIDLPATDHRVLFWQVRQAGATGLLYWCVCWWYGLPSPADGVECFPDGPVHMDQSSSYNTFGSNGDGLLLWPGKDHEPLPSIRLEVIRDGIEDWEYLALLAERIERARALPADARPDAATLARAEELCLVPEEISATMTEFTKDPEVILQRRRAVAEMIERLDL